MVPPPPWATGPADNAAGSGADAVSVDFTVYNLRRALDRYWVEGCALVEAADRLWDEAHDPHRADDMRRVSRHEYERVAAQARTRFKRHDAALDALVRRMGLDALAASLDGA